MTFATYMKKSFYLFLFLHFSIGLFGQQSLSQNPIVDSLINLQKNGKNDSIKARASFLLSDYFYQDTTLSKSYLESGRKLIRNNNFLKGLYHHYFAGIYFYLDSELAIREYQYAIECFEKVEGRESLSFQAKSWHNIGVQYQFLGEPKKFMEILSEHSIPLSRKAQDHGQTALYLGEIGMLLMNNQDYQTASFYFHKGLKTMEAHPPVDQADHLEILVNTARNFLFLQKLDSAKMFIDRAEPIAMEIRENSLFYDFIAVKSNQLNESREFLAAKELLLPAIEAAKRENIADSHTYKINALYFQLYKAYFGSNKFNLAKEALYQGMQYEPYKSAINTVIRYSKLAEVYEKLHDYPSAYRYAQLAFQIRDSVYNEDSRREINAMEKRLQLSQKERQINQLKSDNEQISLIHKNQQLIHSLIAVGSFILLLLVLFLIYVFQNNRRTGKIKLNMLEQQNKIEVAQAVMHAEENERHRIAQELHDGLGGTLSAIKYKLSMDSANSSPDLMKEINKQLENSISDLRGISRNLMPGTLVQSGLDIALKDLCASLATDYLQVEYHSFSIQPSISKDKQLNIYRIIQELLTNSIRHGQASKILVQCSQAENKFFIVLEDNGKGFDKEILKNNMGMGINNIRRRIDLMQGTFEMDSTISEGTTVNIELNV